MYIQCGLRRKNGDGLFDNMVSFIPSQFAIKDKYLKLKNNKGEWENGWQVTGCGAVKTLTEVNEDSQDYKRTRGASDV
jgi:hypothetical protein